MTLSLVAILIDAAIKGAALLAVGWIVTLIMRRNSAAMRHMVWTVCVTAVLLLPAISLLLPRWGPAVVPGVSNLVVASAPSASLPLEGYSVDSARTEGRIPSPLSPKPSPIPQLPLSLLDWVLIIWGIGAMAVIVPVLVGMRVMRYVHLRATDIEGGPIRRQFDSICAEMRIRRHVSLLRSYTQTLPLAWGITRPAVLLPRDASAWPASRVRSVLLHELAHVKRQDCATQLLVQIVCAIHWFNPLAWLASRAMRIEREAACDDIVLNYASDAATYADDLVQLACSFRAPPLSRFAAVAVVGKSNLFARVRAILDADHDRTAITSRRTLLASMVAACVALPIALLQGQDARPTTVPLNPTTGTVIETNPPTLLVTTGNYYLDRAIGSLGLKESATMSPGEYEARKPENYDVILFDRYAPQYLPLRGTFIHFGSLPAGLKLKQSIDPGNQPQMISEVGVRDWKRDHPILKNLDLGKVFAAEAIKLDVPSPESEVLIEGDKGPLVVLHHENNRVHFVVSFDVLQSNWPLKMSFPIFLNNALRYVGKQI